MSHIHLTGIAKAQQLNCVNGPATTISAIEEADSSTNIIFLFLQEPWITNSGQPPSSINYDIFTLPGPRPQCATYIRKSLNLQPRNPLPPPPMHPIDHSGHRQHPNRINQRIHPHEQRSQRLPQTSQHAIKRTHDGRLQQPSRHVVGRTRSRHTNTQQHLEQQTARGYNSQLHRTPRPHPPEYPSGLHILPPGDGKTQPTIIDLTFTKGHATTIAQACSCDMGSGGTLDLAKTVT